MRSSQSRGLGEAGLSGIPSAGTWSSADARAARPFPSPGSLLHEPRPSLPFFTLSGSHPDPRGGIAPLGRVCGPAIDSDRPNFSRNLVWRATDSSTDSKVESALEQSLEPSIKPFVEPLPRTPNEPLTQESVEQRVGAAKNLVSGALLPIARLPAPHFFNAMPPSSSSARPPSHGSVRLAKPPTPVSTSTPNHTLTPSAPSSSMDKRQAPPPTPNGELPKSPLAGAIANYRPSKHPITFNQGILVGKVDKPPQGYYPYTSLDYDDSGCSLVASSTHGTLNQPDFSASLQLINVFTGKAEYLARSKKHGARLVRFTLGNADGGANLKVMHTSDKDHGLRLFDIKGYQYSASFLGHKHTVRSLTRFPAENNFMSACRERMHLWDLRMKTYAVQLEFEDGAFDKVVIHPSGMVVTAGDETSGLIALWDKRKLGGAPFSVFDAGGQAKHAGIEWGRRHLGGWSKLEFGNDDRLLLAAGSGDRASVLLDAASGELKGSMELPSGQYIRRTEKSKERDKAEVITTGSMCFAPDGRYLLGGSGSSNIYVWDTEPLLPEDSSPDQYHQISLRPIKPVHTLENKQAGAVIAFNPRLHSFASADKEVTLWSPDYAASTPH